MKRKFILIFALFIPYLSFSQVVRNVLASQENTNIVINYDLSSPNLSDRFNIELLVSLNGGHSWSAPLLQVSGDVGANIQAGYHKKIIWNVLSEREELVGSDIQFKIRGNKIGNSYSLSGKKGEFVDSRDGNSYHWVRIGDQIWMAENLRYRVNGMSSAYNREPRNILKYGLLYTHKGAQDACPEGWHLPGNAEWFLMMKELGGVVSAGPKLKTVENWFPRKGVNESGFSAKPGGMRVSVAGAYMYKSINRMAYFWSADDKSNYDAHSVYLRNDFDKAYTKALPKEFQLSVRCIKD